MQNDLATCLIVAGEKSGEEHCLSFFPSLQAQCPQIRFFGVGGEELKKSGMELVYHLQEFSGWGITEVVHRLPFYVKAMHHLLHLVDSYQCQVAILIDFQTFNLTLAQKLKKRGVQVLYYVAPQAWAWKAYRAQLLQKSVHTLFTILPFEKNWFQQRGVHRVIGVPHPIKQRFQADLPAPAALENEVQPFPPSPVQLLLLPGSRAMEVSTLLPIFLQVAQQLRQHLSVQVTLVAADSLDPSFFVPFQSQIDRILSPTHLALALKTSHVCLAASGTVTLTAALFTVPTVVCYKVSLFSEFFYRNFVPYQGPIALANIVLQKNILPELVQDEVTAFNIKKIMAPWLTDREQYEKMKKALSATSEALSGEAISVAEYMSAVIHSAY